MISFLYNCFVHTYTFFKSRIFIFLNLGPFILYVLNEIFDAYS